MSERISVNKLRRQLHDVHDAVQRKMKATTDSGLYGRGLSPEGYEGGYLAALSEVSAHLAGYCASGSGRHNEIWEAVRAGNSPRKGEGE